MNDPVLSAFLRDVGRVRGLTVPEVEDAELLWALPGSAEQRARQLTARLALNREQYGLVERIARERLLAPTLLGPSPSPSPSGERRASRQDLLLAVLFLTLLAAMVDWAPRLFTQERSINPDIGVVEIDEGPSDEAAPGATEASQTGPVETTAEVAPTEPPVAAPPVAAPPVAEPPVAEPPVPEVSEPDWRLEPLEAPAGPPAPGPKLLPTELLSLLTFVASLLAFLGITLSLLPREQALERTRRRERLAAADRELDLLLREDLEAGRATEVAYGLRKARPASRSVRESSELLARLGPSAESRELDVDATVQATSRTAGRIAPIYARSGEHRPIVVLLDLSPTTALFARDVERWVGELRGAGAEVELHTFHRSPERVRLRSPGAHATSQREVPLDRLAREREQALCLLVHAGLDEASRGDFVPAWMLPLRRWSARAWLDPSRVAPDASRLRVLQRAANDCGLLRFPLTPSGLAALARWLEHDGWSRPKLSWAHQLALPGGLPSSSPRTEEERRLTLALGLIALVPDASAAQFQELIEDLGLDLSHGLSPAHFEQLCQMLGRDAVDAGGRVVQDAQDAAVRVQRLRQLAAQDPRLRELVPRARALLVQQIRRVPQPGRVAELRAQNRLVLHAALDQPDGGAVEGLWEAMEGPGAAELHDTLSAELSARGDRSLSREGRGWRTVWDWARVETEEVVLSPRALSFRGMAGALAAAALVAVCAGGAGVRGVRERLPWPPLPVASPGVVDWRLVWPELGESLVDARGPELVPPEIVPPTDQPAPFVTAPAPVAAPVAAAPAEARAVAEPSPALVELAPVEVAPPEVAPAPVPESRCDRPETHPTMVPISPGSFRSGDGRDITLTRRYAIANTEVTQAQYAAVMGESRLEALAYDDLGGVSLRGPDLPMQGVSWNDAVAYCNKLSGLEGLDEAYEIEGERVTLVPSSKGYRLPTKAEWEYAARAGTRDAYSGTNEESKLCTVANVADKSALAAFPDWTWTTPCDDGAAGLAPVCAYAPNGYSLYDMSGNVWEWTWDWYEPNSSETQDPDGPDSGSYRVNRGGSWVSIPAYARVADRGGNSPSIRGNNLGFRPARSL